MAVYIFTIALTTLLSWVWTKVDNKSKKLVFILMLIAPVLVSGLRVVGTDYFNYMYRFDFIKMGFFDAGEFSFLYLLMELFIKLGLEYQHFVFTVSFFTVFTAFYLICKYNNVINVPIAIFSYMTMFYQMSFNIFRQILSVEILLLALFWLNRNDKIKFAVFLILSSLIHTSSLLFGALYFVFPIISKDKYKKSRMIIYCSLAILVFMLPTISQLGAFIINKFPHYAYYFNNFAYKPIGLGMIRYILLVIFPVVVLSYLYKKKNNPLNKFYTEIFSLGKAYNLNYCVFLSIIGMILWMFSYVSFSALYRIGYTGLIALPVVHGYTVKCVENKQNRIILTLCIAFFLCFFWWYDFIYLNTGETYPYVLYRS